jgi:hypothetical protein
MGMSDQHLVNLAPLDPGPFEISREPPCGRKEFTGPGIDQNAMVTRIHIQAGIGWGDTI